MQVICNRIVILDSGRIIADKPTEELARLAFANERYSVKILGPQREVTEMLRAHAGIKSVEQTGEGDKGIYTYTIESDPNTDIRSSLFTALAERAWPLMGLEELGASLEDIFISIVDSRFAAEDKEKKARASWDSDDTQL